MNYDMAAVYIIALIFWSVLRFIALWKAFEKAGEDGWKSIIPFYNLYIMYKIAGYKNWFWYTLIISIVGGLIAGFVPDNSQYITGCVLIINAIISIVVDYNFARKYDWGVFPSILFVLFKGICLLFLGFGDSQYISSKNKNIGRAKNFSSNRRINNSDEGYRKCPYCGEDIRSGAKKCRYCGEFFN